MLGTIEKKTPGLTSCSEAAVGIRCIGQLVHSLGYMGVDGSGGACLRCPLAWIKF